MKKILMMILMIIFLPLFVNAKSVDKSAFTNQCSGYASGNCAFCVYEFYNNANKDYYIKLAFTYKSDVSIIDNMYYVEWQGSGTENYGIRINIPGDVYKEDFISGNSISCPTLTYGSVTNTDKDFRGYVFEISKTKGNTLSPTNESVIVQETKDEDTPEEVVYACDYDSFRIGLVNKEPNVYLKNHSSKSIINNLDASLFKNNNCPTIYTCTYSTVYYVTYTTTKPSLNGNSCVEHKGSVINMENGEIKEDASMDSNSDTSQTIRLNYDSICSDNNIKSAVKIIGYIILVVKWIVPLIIIVLGMVDFGKASISNDEKAINKATGALIRRFIAGIVIFFIPTIIMAALNVVELTKGIEKEDDTNFGACTKCLFDPVNDCQVSKIKPGSTTHEGSSGTTHGGAGGKF